MKQEHTRSALSGYLMLSVGIAFAALAVYFLVVGIRTENPWYALGLGLALLLALAIFAGLFIVNPNDSRVLVLFGVYKGTVKDNGFFWANPFLTKKKITLRARNLNGERLKVNDKAGNPIEIAAVVVWQVDDTYRASFEVDQYKDYVVVQSEAAVRKLCGAYPYDNFADDHDEALTLRAGTEQVNDQLERELAERFARAGVKVIEARISHLAYAQEIAEAMLRRQQASAIVAARTQIVDGAVGMVELALAKLAEKGIVDLDEDKKATMVSNLLVVLCSESNVSPVVNAGTLYQ
jgi:hypothetical protein